MIRVLDNTWARRTLFVGLNVLFVAGIVIGILPIQALFAERDEQIALKRALLVRLQAVANQDSMLRKLASEPAPEPVEFLRGPNEGVISAELQTRVQGLALSAGAKVRSVRALPARSGEHFKFIGAQLDMYAPVQAVRQVVAAIETAKPYLFIAGAVIKPTAPVGRAPTEAPEEPTLDVQLEIIGALPGEDR